MRHLELCALTAEHRVILPPVKREGISGPEHQRHERAAPGRLLLSLLPGPPNPRECRNPALGAGEAQRHEIGMNLHQVPMLLA